MDGKDKKNRVRNWFGNLTPMKSFLFGIVFAILIVVIAGAIIVKVKNSGYGHEITDTKKNGDRPELQVDLIEPNEYSRPQIKLKKVNGIVIHYTANPGSTAKQNRDYFNGLQYSKKTKASAHFIIGLDGEIVQCIPCKEIAYASNNRNYDTISIECCIPDDTGKFNDKTRKSLIELTTWLMGRYDLSIDDVIRHYDVTGKLCPKYYVEHEDAWKKLKDDMLDYIDKKGSKAD